MKEILEGQIKAIQGFANALTYHDDPKITKQLLLDIINEAEDAVHLINEEEGDDSNEA